MGRSYYYALFTEGLREAKLLPQNQIASEWISQDSNPGSLTSELFASLVTPIHQPRVLMKPEGGPESIPPPHPI